jgi:hypothetical protein
VVSVNEQKTVYRNPTKTVGFVAAGVYGAAMMIFIVAFTHPNVVNGVKVGLGLVLSLWSILRPEPLRGLR